jgi:RimJ/RimL family protein N-acetyltransferase
MNVQPVTLTGKTVRLDPLSLDQLDDQAFNALGCMRVEFKTDRLNERSRQALRRIGAVEEGTLRCHMLTEQGRWRDSVYYSIVAEEWPSVRMALEQRLAR